MEGVETIYIYVTTGYSVGRLFLNEDIVDFQENLPDDQTGGKKITECSLEVMARYPSVISFIEPREDEEDTVIKILDYLDFGLGSAITVDRWNPIFKCTSMHKALRLLPKIVKVCREIDWCEVFTDQEFSKNLKGPFRMGKSESVYILKLSAESG
jgi:hypothetical protein